MGIKRYGKVVWKRTGDAEYTSSVERTYYAVIAFTPPGDYLTTVYDSEDAEVTSDTLATRGLAKDFFRKFLLDK